MEVTAKIDNVFLLAWPAPVDKGNNLTTVEDRVFFTHDETRATIVPATEEEVAAWNNKWPEEGEGSEKRIPASSIPFTGKVATSNLVGATSVGIRGDKKEGEGVELIESLVTVTTTAGSAVSWGVPVATDPEDNETTPG